MDRPPVTLLGVHIHTLGLEALLDFIEQTVAQGRRAQVLNVNSHAMNIAFEQPRFRAGLNQAEVVFCDGFGVMWAARLQGKRIPHRYTPPDWIHQLCALCERRGIRVYLLGARPGVAEKAAAELVKMHPDLQIAGTQHGYFDKSLDSTENHRVVEQINRAAAQILIVGFGMPMQEYWVAENWNALNVNVAIAAGALFDYVAGEVWRAPRWMTDHGLEWLARLAVEPGRLWRRYIWGIPIFLVRVGLERFGLVNLSGNRGRQ